MAFYRIKEAADKVGVLPHVLRFWESQFPRLKPPKTTRGQRLYSDEDIENFLRVKHLLYTEGYSISGAKKVLKEDRATEKVGVIVESEILREIHTDLSVLRDFAKDFA